MSSAKRIAEVRRYIAANVRRCRTEQELTQEALAERVGVELRYLQEIESATANLSLGVLIGTADALGVDPAMLLAPAKLERPKRGRPTRVLSSDATPAKSTKRKPR